MWSLPLILCPNAWHQPDMIICNMCLANMFSNSYCFTYLPLKLKFFIQNMKGFSAYLLQEAHFVVNLWFFICMVKCVFFTISYLSVYHNPTIIIEQWSSFWSNWSSFFAGVTSFVNAIHELSSLSLSLVFFTSVFLLHSQSLQWLSLSLSLSIASWSFSLHP